jgi:hypothetical protein
LPRKKGDDTKTTIEFPSSFGGAENEINVKEEPYMPQASALSAQQQKDPLG